MASSCFCQPAPASRVPKRIILTSFGTPFAQKSRTFRLPGVRGVEHPLRCAPDVGARSVALDERQDGLVGHAEAAAGDGDGLAILRDLRRWAGHRSAPLRGRGT